MGGRRCFAHSGKPRQNMSKSCGVLLRLVSHFLRVLPRLCGCHAHNFLLQTLNKENAPMEDMSTLKRMLQMSRRLHAIAKRLDPDDPELATIEESLDEAEHAE